jgi:hypothetical protein
MKAISEGIKNAMLAAIKFYRRCIAPLGMPKCKYYPSCPEYTREAISKFGVLRGSFKAAVRILKCNPFSRGGYDPLK